MRKFLLLIALLFIALTVSFAKKTVLNYDADGAVSYYYEPKYIDYTLPYYANCLYTFKKDGTGWLMLGVSPEMFTNGCDEPIMSYYLTWSSFNDTLRTTIMLDDKIIERQYFEIIAEGDSISLVKEYPEMKSITLWKIPKAKMDEGKLRQKH